MNDRKFRKKLKGVILFFFKLEGFS